MFCGVISKVADSCFPPSCFKLLLCFSALEPPESPVKSSAPLLLDGTINESLCCCIISSDPCGRLTVPHFFQTLSDWNGFFGTHADGSHFGLCSTQQDLETMLFEGAGQSSRPPRVSWTARARPGKELWAWSCPLSGRLEAAKWRAAQVSTNQILSLVRRDHHEP